jgi:hypothetical protein
MGSAQGSQTSEMVGSSLSLPQDIESRKSQSLDDRSQAGGCVFSIHNAPGMNQFCKLVSLDLSELKSWQAWDMFPEKGFEQSLHPGQ